MLRKPSDPVLEYARRMARILYAIEYLGRYCYFCKLDGFEFPWLIDFHHKDEKTKSYEVKNKLYGGAFNSHKKEIDKCILTCVSCHRNNHANKEKYQQHRDIILEKLEEIRKNGTGKITKNHFLTGIEMDKILQMINEGFIMSEISEQLNLNYGTVKSFVKRNKLDPKKRFRIRISGSIIVKMLNTKHSIRNIAEKININRESLRLYIKENIKCNQFENGVKRYFLIKSP
jgi:hypothetical protein